MVQAADIQAITPALTVWQVYDPAVKAELYSTALRVDDHLLLVDPIPLADSALEELTASASIRSVILTNANHARAAALFAAKSGRAILASAATASLLFDLGIQTVAAGDQVGGNTEVIAIAGAAKGEIALHFKSDGGAMVVGDALIHFEPNGFALLPAKYCSEQKTMRHSLRQLLDFSFERLLFAHGTPIVSSARSKLEALLACR